MSQIDDIVERSGVSRSTVYRFLRGEGVRPKARDAILKAMQVLNIQHEDHSVHVGSTLLVSIRPGFKSFRGYDLSISGFVDRAEAYGFHVRLKTGNAASALEAKTEGKGIAGVLFLGKTMQEEREESAALRNAGIPHIFVNRMFDDPSYSWVSVDHRKAASDAVEYLFDLGFSEVGTWGITKTYRVDLEKRVGYLRAHEERGLEVPGSCLDYERHGDLEEAVQSLIDDHALPPAWFAASDEHAMRLVRVMRNAGLAVPDDLVIVGMDDVEPAEYFNPALTSVHIPFRSAGAAAFDALRHLIENPEEESIRVVMKHHLVVRESCGGKVANVG